MGTVQAATPVGIMIGYVLAGITMSFECPECQDKSEAGSFGTAPALWRIPFLIQCFFLGFLCIAFSRMPQRLFDPAPEASGPKAGSSADRGAISDNGTRPSSASISGGRE